MLVIYKSDTKMQGQQNIKFFFYLYFGIANINPAFKGQAAHSSLTV